MPADVEGRGLIDLSHRIEDGMPVYPGDPAVHIRHALALASDGVAVDELQFGTHTGTHVDAPSHTVAGGRTMADVRLDELVGEALVIHVGGLGGREVCDWHRLDDAAGGLPESVPPIVLVNSGWARWFPDDERRARHPSLAADAARELVARGMHVLGVDMLSPDPTGADDDAFPVHEAVLGADGLIVENLRGLEQLPHRIRVGFFPLRLGGDGSPVRAVAGI
ncbi:cyclase family protein [Microbacterium sp. NPDC057407]|uniref:cyclase family protein n=1 Tax=Microbacterium sp. NPDC057407 TaxID=3346120 RepID=UPI00366C09A4